MQLPIKAHYATLAMLSLAVRYQTGQLQTARAVASQQSIPSQFLGQILQQLRTAGLIVSIRGSSGGFKLAMSPEQISVADIVEAVYSGSTNELSGVDRDPIGHVVYEVWRELDQQQTQFLQGLTLAELSKRLTPDAAGMFYI